MSRFYRYLLVTDYNDRLSSEQAEVDVVSWDSILEIGNAADFDAWVLNIAAIQRRVPPRVFTSEEIEVLFNRKTMLHVVGNGGRIIIVGDLAAGVFTQPSDGSTSVPAKAAGLLTPSPFYPFADMIHIGRDPRPVDYRRISRPEDYSYSRVYAYLDQVTKWEHSLIVKEQGKVVKVTELATTNFGTCLAAIFEIFSGSILVLPSLGTTVEDDDNYILQHFLTVKARASMPTWAEKLVVPEQRAVEGRLQNAERQAADFVVRVEREKEGLVKVQRWKRLLYDDGFSLEEIVKEAFEVIGASVTKPSKEKDDFRIAVAGQLGGVLEVKGTRKDQFGRRDLRQVSEWMEEAMSEQLSEVKGVFVGNAAREKEPSARGVMFDPNNVSYAKLKGMVLLRTADLYCLVLLELTDGLNKDEFWREFFACVGEFDASKYWKLLPTEFSWTASSSG